MTQIALLCAVLAVGESIALLTPEQYAQEYVSGVDRLYQPLTKDMCGQEPYKSNLKSCLLLRQNKKKMKEISEEHLVYPFNYWKGEGINVLSTSGALRETLTRVSAATNFYSSLSTTHQQLPAIARKRRNAERSDTNESIDESKHRQKRGLGNNPCAEDTSRRTVLLHALDAQTGVVLELFQNPDQHMYQTFFTKNCLPLRHPQFGCSLQYIEFFTAVFDPLSTKSEDVIVRPVKIPSGCALVLLQNGGL